MSSDNRVAQPEPRPVNAGPVRVLKPLVSLKSHPRLALAVLLGCLAVGTPSAWFLGRPVYRAEAAVYVSPRFQKILEESKELDFQSHSQYREYVEQQVRTITRFDVIRDALATLGPLKQVWVKPDETEQRSVERLQAALRVSPVLDTYLITVALDRTEREGLPELVNAVVQKYLEVAKAEEFYGTDQRLASLQKERSKLEAELDALQRTQTELAQELGVTTFNRGVLNPYDQLLIGIQEALGAARRDRIAAEAAFLALDDEGWEGGGDALNAIAQETLAQDAGLNALQAYVGERRAGLLAKRSGLGPEHLGRQGIDRELAELEREVERATADRLAATRTVIIDRLRGRLFQARRLERELALEVEAQQSRATWYASRYQEALAVDAEIDRARRRLESIDNRVDFLVIEAEAPGFARLSSPARQPETPVRGGKRKYLLAVLLLSLLAAGVVPSAADYFDPRVHAPNDLERVVGFQPMGWVIDKHDTASRDFAEDQLIRLATKVERDRREQGTRIWTLTSVKPGGGVTTLVFDIARHLRALGVRPLVVEANAFRPDPRFAAPGHEVGLRQLLSTMASRHDAVLPAVRDGPDRLPVGPGEGRHLADAERLAGVIRSIGEHYDIVLIDAPPILISADAERLVGLSDGVLLVVEAAAVNRGAVRRAGVVLERLAPSVVGSVLNRVRVLSGGGYFTELLGEYREGRRLELSRWLSPWLWR